ncbi:hypothetical protein ACWEWI_25630 [Streptomyces sp. NPDC003753]
MSDDDTPDNVRQLPRIGSPPPPPVPPQPDLNGDRGDPDAGPGHVRISAFDAPEVPHAPRTPDTVPAALRSDGLPDGPAPDAGPPRTGALSLAAILAIALAAFEGLHSWIQESGPRRAEAAKHQRELELLAAKAGADAHRMGAEVDAQRAKSQRRIPSSHEYGRGALGRGSGGPGRLGGGHGPGGFRRAGTGPFSGSGSGSGRGGGRSGPSGTSGGRSGNGRNSGSTSRGGWGSGAGSRGGSGGGSRGGLGGGNNTRAGTGGVGGRNNGSTGGAGGPGGWRSPRQAVSDWLHGRKRIGKGTGSGSADTAARIRDTVRKQKTGPTFWDQVSSRAKDRWKKRQGDDSGGSATGGNGGNGGNVNGKPDTNAGDWTPPGDGERVKLKDAAYSAFRARWEKRREGWKARGGPRRTPPPREPKDPGSSRRAGSGRRQKPKNFPGSAGGSASGDSRGAPGPGPFGPRSSAFDTDDGPDVTITYEQMDPPGAHAKRWEPDAITTGRQQLPRQTTPVLPRAPQRPAGQRPGTTRRKEPIPMPAVSPRPGAPAPVTATVPASGGMSARHATDIRLDDVLKALTVLTTAGMETHDECAELARHARRLLGELETMAHDLADNHNVTGAKTMRAVAALMESVGTLIVQAERMAQACLMAAELAEAEEQAMARDHRPMQAAYIDAGVAAPSARIHNEN